jgi:hypothetical protein
MALIFLAFPRHSPRQFLSTSAQPLRRHTLVREPVCLIDLVAVRIHSVSEGAFILYELRYVAFVCI